MSQAPSFHCDICDDGPFHYRHQVVGLNVIEDIGCMGPCAVENAEKHICTTCAEFIAGELRARKKAARQARNR